MAKRRELWTTREVAEALGVSRQTLQTWITTGQIEAPALPAPGLGVRLWTMADIERARAYRDRFYRKGRGEASKLTVKFKETAWRFNEKHREVTDGVRVFVFHPVGTYPPGDPSRIKPVAWQEKKSGRLVDVTDPETLQILNSLFRFMYGRLRR